MLSLLLNDEHQDLLHSDDRHSDALSIPSGDCVPRSESGTMNSDKLYAEDEDEDEAGVKILSNLTNNSNERSRTGKQRRGRGDDVVAAKVDFKQEEKPWTGQCGTRVDGSVWDTCGQVSVWTGQCVTRVDWSVCDTCGRVSVGHLWTGQCGTLMVPFQTRCPCTV